MECLSDKALLFVRSNDCSEIERAHVQSCLSCGRRYRELVRDLELITTAIKQPPPAETRSAARSWIFSDLRWSLAAAMVLVAFLSGWGISAWRGKSAVHANVASARDNTRVNTATAASDVRASDTADQQTALASPAQYGFYLETLMAANTPDEFSDQESADQNNTYSEMGVSEEPTE